MTQLVMFTEPPAPAPPERFAGFIQRLPNTP